MPGFLLLTLLMVAPQDVVVIGDGLDCSTCAIELTKKLELGSHDGPGLLADYMGESVVGDRAGGYWFFSHSIRDQLWRFDQAGNAVVVSRRGTGPSEFRSIVAIGGAIGGGLLAYDHGNGRLVEFSVSGEVVSTDRLGAVLTSFSNMVPVGQDSVLIGAVRRDGPQLGVPVHLVSMSTGSVLQGYGDPPPTYQAQFTPQVQRRSVSRFGSTVAASHYWEYRTDLFDLATGHSIKSVVRTPRWYRPVEDLMSVNPPRTRPVPNTVSVRLLGDGTMLTLIKRPRANWLEGFSGKPSVEGMGRVVSRSLVYETVVEHVDYENGVLLAQSILAGVPLSFVSGRLELAVVDDAGLTPRILVYSIKVKR